MHFPIKLAAVAVATVSLAQALSIAERATSGIATFYTGAVGSCSFDGYTYPTGVYGTALGLNLYSTVAQCGACVSITNAAGKKITAMIVDECPGGCAGKTFDLFQNGFTQLATLVIGEIPITWDYVNCPITTPFKLRTKEGSSQYWFAIQVYNANQAITKLEFSADNGATWKSCTRQTYNYWLYPSGTGSATVQIRVTAKNGKVVITKNVPTAEKQTVTAASNF